MKKMKQHKNRIHQRSAGLSLIEVLISLAIVAMLLTATGVAFDAALKNYKINHDMTSVSVSARNALYQMTSTLRSAWNLDPDTDPNAAIYVATDGKSCSMLDAGGNPCSYRYNQTTKELQVNIDDVSDESKWYVLVANVYPITTDAGEKIFSATITSDNLVSKVEIRFMVTQEGLSRTVSAAAVPRNILYSM